MDSTYFLRQLDIADPTRFKDKPITVMGAAGMGAASDYLQIPIEDAADVIGIR